MAWTTATAMKNSFDEGRIGYQKSKTRKASVTSSDKDRLAKLRKRLGSN